MKRGKGRKADQESSTDVLMELADKLQSADGLSADDCLRLLGCGVTSRCPGGLYDKQCKGKKDAPACLHGLLPAPGGYKKKGLWCKDIDSLSNLGADPNELKRQDPAHPAGLRNLGNTCYVNSVLQVLFMIRRFRSALYALEESLAEQPIISQLRTLFAEMEYGPWAAVDPRAFAESLQLDHTVQQDGQEFMKLLLNWLHERVAQSQQQDVRGLVPELFRGTYCYETRCQRCGRLSDSSARATDFYELAVPVKGFKHMMEGLASTLEMEFLEGDNQYACDACAARTDATRQMAVRSLPPILCVSLQRFVFDMKTLSKVKVQDKASFPLHLDLNPLCGPSTRAPPGDLQYELYGILVHKGASASRGHYVAHIRDDQSGKWWRFDDEEAAEITGGPASMTADHGAQPGADKKAGADKTAAAPGRKRKKGAGGGRGAAVDLTGCDSGEPSAAAARDSAAAAGRGADGPASTSGRGGGDGDGDGGGGGGAAEISSSNAYMLVYRRRGWRDELGELLQRGECQALLAQMQTRAERFKDECTQHEVMRRELEEQVESRRAHVRRVMEAALAQGDGAAGVAGVGPEAWRFVSCEWLATWAGQLAPPPAIDNSRLLCEHGRLDFRRAADMKRVSLTAWHELVCAYGGGPELSPQDVCPACIAGSVAAASQQQAAAAAQGRLLTDVVAALETGEGRAGGYYVSKHWLNGWKRREGRSIGDVCPTANITCAHGGLLPERSEPRAARAIVPPHLFERFKEQWEGRAAALDSGGSGGRPAPSLANGHARAAEAQAADASAVDVIDVDGDELGAAGQPHGDATPAHSGGARHGAGAAAKRGGADVAQLRCFPVGCPDCGLCAGELSERETTAQESRALKAAQRAALPSLVAGANVYVDAGQAYYVVPKWWMEQWRAWVVADDRAPAKDKPLAPQSEAPARGLAACVAELVCRDPQHAAQRGATRQDCALAGALPALVQRRGRWAVGEAGQVRGGDGGGGGGGAELLAPGDWEALSGWWWRDGDVDDAQLPRGVRVVVVAAEEAGGGGGGGGGGVEGSWEDEVVLDGPMAVVQRPASFRSRGGAALALAPDLPPCGACAAAHEAAALAAKLDYGPGCSLVVEDVAVVEEARLTGQPAAAGTRTSKRAKRGRAALEVSSSGVTLAGLKLLVFERLGVHPLNADLYVRGKLLEGDDATLAELCVYKDDVLRCFNAQRVDDEDDVSGCLPGAKAGAGERERGFAGTALTGAIAAKAE